MTKEIVQSAANFLRLGRYKLQLNSMPRMMGILNVTPDSFSDGDLYLDPARAEEQALRLEAEGASIIDVGGESSRPGSSPVSADEELRRVLPVLQRIMPQLKIPVSVDTYKLEVVERVLDAGVVLINDIYGLRHDLRIPRTISRYRAGVAIMHMRGTPINMQHNVRYENIEDEVLVFLTKSCNLALEGGIATESILIDPGIGFGKSAKANCDLIRLIPRLRTTLGFPVLVGLSRKSFLTKISKLGVDDLSCASSIVHAMAAYFGVDFIRTHEVRRTVQAAEMAKCFRTPGEK